VIEKRFHSDLYDGNAVDAAVRVYEGFGTFELEKTPEAFIVRIRANSGIDERRLADELANYALGTTIESRNVAGGHS
jgi:hypothetical protein